MKSGKKIIQLIDSQESPEHSCFGCGKLLNANKESFVVFPDINKNQTYLCKECLKDIERNKTMYKEPYFEDVDSINRNLLHIPKVIAKITICKGLQFSITEDMNWDPPTSEQIKNLKETFNIDVELMESGAEDNKIKTYRIYEEGYRATGESVGAHYVGEAEGESFIDACKNFIKKNNKGKIKIDSSGNEYASDWGCRWFPTLEEAQKSFG